MQRAVHCIGAEMWFLSCWRSFVSNCFYRSPLVHAKLFDDPVYSFDQWSRNRSALFRHRPEPLKWCARKRLQRRVPYKKRY